MDRLGDLLSALTVAESIAIVGLAGSLVAWWTRRSFALQAEARLRTDTEIKAITLLTKDATPEQRAGALLALVELGQIEFALELLRGIWANDSVEVGTALWVIEQALDSSDEDFRGQAVGILERNAEKLVISGEPLFPRQLTRHRWPTSILRTGRSGLLRTLAVMAGEVPVEKRRTIWPEFMRLASRVVADDGDARLRCDAGMWLQTLVQESGIDRMRSFHDAANERWTPGELFEAAELERGIAEISPTAEMFTAMGDYADLAIAEAWTPAS